MRSIVQLTVVNFFRKESNKCRPSSHSQQRQDHFGHDTTMHTHEGGPLRVLVHFTGTVLYRSVNTGAQFLSNCPYGHLQSNVPIHSSRDGRDGTLRRATQLDVP